MKNILKYLNILAIIIALQCFLSCEYFNRGNRKDQPAVISFAGYEHEPEIKVLSFSARKIRSEDIANVNKFKDLEELSLAENPITSIEALRGNETIKELILSYTYVSDISPLSENTTLESLTVAMSKVRRIDKLPVTLKELIIDETVAEDSIEAYRKKNPDCEIKIISLSRLNKHLHPERWWEDPTSKTYKHDYLHEK